MESGGPTEAFAIADEHLARVFPNEDIPPAEMVSWILRTPDRIPENKHEMKGRAWFKAAYDKVDEDIANCPMSTLILGDAVNEYVSQPPDTVSDDESREIRADASELAEVFESRGSSRRRRQRYY